jgi:AcrR family transcriptional regulator
MLETRVYDSACQLYARLGWAGTSIEAVAREAKVGKSSIYRRWSDAGAVLVDALGARIELPLDIDTGSVRDDLVILARAIWQLLISDVGESLVRLSAEAATIPVLWTRWRAFSDARIAGMGEIVQRGIARGELRADTAVPVLLDALFGGLLIHYLTAANRGARTLADEDYPQTLVDFVVRTAGTGE